MIGLRDATMLALTKLRTRKIRLTITIVVSGLLFSGLAAASFVAHGVINGINDFGKEGLGSRYIAGAYTQTNFGYHQDPETIDRAIAIHKDLVARKQAEAKRLGIPYEASAEPSPVNEYDGPNGKQRSLDITHPAGKQAALEYLDAHPLPGEDDVKKIAAPYQPKHFFNSRNLPLNLEGGQLKVLKDGQETFDNATMDFSHKGTDTLTQAWVSMSRGLLEPFILPGQNLDIGSDGSIPILAPHSAVEELLGLESLPASASASERLERTKEVRTKAPDIRFSVCYRNSTSANLVQQAIATQHDMERNKDNKDYQKPDLIYGLPTEPCGEVPIIRDVRSQQEKTLAAKQQEFNRIFGTPDPAQSVITFRVVGVMPDIDFGFGGGPAFGVGQIIRSLVASSLGGGWFTPIEAIEQDRLLNSLFSLSSLFGSIESQYVEFHTAAQAKAFIKKENCSVDFRKVGPGGDPAAYCAEQELGPFTLAPFGSNSLALEDARRGFGKIFGWAALGVSVIAGIIMMGTVGRMIADSRRETAVFRAIGAKRLDIAKIYVVYAICLSLLVALFALAVGMGLALYVDHRWSTEATLQALTAYNAQDLNKTFSLYAWHTPNMLIIVGLALASGLLSAVLPLLRNLRRNPIRDMRDET